MLVQVVQFQAGDTKSKIFLPKNQHRYRPLEVSKVSKFDFQSRSISKSLFHVKNHWNLPLFFSMNSTNLGAHFFHWHFLIISIFKPFFISKNDAQFLTACHYTNLQHSIISFGGKNLSYLYSRAPSRNHITIEIHKEYKTSRRSFI